MKVAILGSSGFIGSALRSFLYAKGVDVTLVPHQFPLDPKLLSVDAVINLAGESIMGRWTAAKKRRIRDSRLRTTQLLVQSMHSLSSPPSLLLNASAVGFYGSRGDEELSEASSAGEGFLASVCQEWEAAAETAAEVRARVVCMRFGAVLAPQGGMLKNLLPLFKWGLGGRVGDGKQWLSWIALDDVLGSIWHTLTASTYTGPVNSVSPAPVTNALLTELLAKTLHRPHCLPLPASLARLLFGQMADELLLASTRVIPCVLLASGYTFQLPTLAEALPRLIESTLPR